MTFAQDGCVPIGCALHETQSDDFKLSVSESSSLPAGSNVWLHATFEQRSVDLPGAFENGGGAMKMATFSGEIDIAITGAKTSAVVRLASTGKDADRQASDKTVRIVIPLSSAAAIENGVVSISPTSTILLSHNTGSLSTTGSGGESNAGFATTLLAPALRSGSALLNLSYGRWDAIQNVVVLSRLELRSGVDHGATRLRWRNTPTPVKKKVQLSQNGVGVVGQRAISRGSAGLIRTLSPTQVAQAFVQYVNDVGLARAHRFVYPPLPGLTKSFAMVPVMTYTTVDAMLHVPSGLDANGLEALLEGMVRIVVQHDDDERQSMLQATKTPPANPGGVSPWREVAAQAVHLAIRFAVEYREDGVVYPNSTGELGFAQLESWLGQATRSFFSELNDCDGSALLAMRLARHIGLAPYGDDRWRDDGVFISIDPGYDDERHPWTRAVRNALSHTDSLIFTVVGASTGEGGEAARSAKAGTASSSNTGGHAVPLFLPTISMLRALTHGLRGAANEHGHPKFGADDRERLSAAFARVLYPTGKLRGAGWIEESDSEDETSVITRVRSELATADSPQPLAIDGTVTSAMDLHVDGDRAERRGASWHQTLRQFQRLGPTIADRVVDLTVANGHLNHAFYRHFVEGAIVGALGDDPELLEAGVAAPHFVFARRYSVDAWEASASRRLAEGGVADSPTVDRMEVGASPADLARGSFALLPVVPVTAEQAGAMNAMRHMLSSFSIPPRPTGLTTASQMAIGNVNRSLAAIEALDHVLEERFESHELPEDESNASSEEVFLEMYLTPRALWNNPHSVEHFVERVKAVAKRGRADIIDLRGVQDAAFAVSVGIYV